MIGLMGLICKRTRGPDGEPVTWTQRSAVASGKNITKIATDSSTYFTLCGSDGLLGTATSPASDSWTSRTSGFSTDEVYGIAYGNSTWAIGGSSGKISSATDPTSTWTARTSGFGAHVVYDIASDNGSYFCAAGDIGNMSSTTDAASTWTARTSGFGTSDHWAVVYGNSMRIWVVTGADGKLATATSPSGTWTLRTSSFTSIIIRGMGYGNSLFVAGGATGKMATASDPTGTWTQRTSGLTSSQYCFDVNYGAGSWVLCGGQWNISDHLATSTDPTTGSDGWTTRTSNFTDGGACLNAAYGFGYWVLVGQREDLSSAVPGI